MSTQASAFPAIDSASRGVVPPCTLPAQLGQRAGLATGFHRIGGGRIAVHRTLSNAVQDDWMLDDNYKGAVSAAVQRLGVKARAAGIHLVFAAQRPDKDVMPMQLRENLGNRLILKVASEATSKIALDRPGAELLLGRGHMAAKLNGEQGLVFAQAPFLSDDDIALVVAAIQADDANK